jgi:inorganic triphosphatase YgiF
MATEIEMKMRVPDQETMARVLADPTLQEFMLDAPTVKHMSSVYYDTPNGDLTARKWTLRRRLEGDRVIVALKTANISSEFGVFTRNEWQCATENVEDAIPLLMEQGAPPELKNILKGQTLVEHCRAEFERTSAYLYMEEGVRIEMAGDVGELRGGDSVEPICELELELLFGGAEALPPVCNRLAEDYGLIPESRSKYERAAALAE